MSGGKILQQIEIDLRNPATQEIKTVYLDIFDNSLSRKWLAALDHLLANHYHLEKNYCFFGFVHHGRNGPYILDQVNKSIAAINSASIGYQIDDWFDMSNTFTDDPEEGHPVGRNIIHDKFNWLHRYFEDLQGVSGRISEFYLRADPATR